MSSAAGISAEYGGDGFDFDWVLTHGAAMTWCYAFSVQSWLADVEAAYAAGDWPTCVAASGSALLAMTECEYRGAGLSRAVTPVELCLTAAVSTGPAQVALRDLPPAGSATREQAEAAVEVVRQQDALLREQLPVNVPLLRSPAGSAGSMRLSASILKWRKERGLTRVYRDR